MMSEKQNTVDAQGQFRYSVFFLASEIVLLNTQLGDRHLFDHKFQCSLILVGLATFTHEGQDFMGEGCRFDNFWGSRRLLR